MKRVIGLILLGLLAAPLSYGQAPAGTDLQARFLNHWQQFEKEQQFGWAAWTVVPNVLQTEPVRALGVAGVAIRSKDKARWIEFMVGAYVDTGGRVDPVIDVRAGQKLVMQKGAEPLLHLSEEALYLIRPQRLVVPLTATLPLAIPGPFKLRAGLESDLSCDPERCRASGGVRISATKDKYTVAAAYQEGIKNQQSFVRLYFLINW